MTPSSPKIVVLGAGAVGSLIGALLARAGEDVTLIARPAHAAALRAGGLRVEGLAGVSVLPVRAAERLEFQPALVLLAVKTQDVEGACRENLEWLRAATVLTLQNGLRSDDLLAGLLPRGNILSGVVMMNVQFLEPGRVHLARAGGLVVGAPFGANDRRVYDLGQRLERAVPTRVSDDMRGVHCTKLLVNNVFNGLEAISGLPIRECMRAPGLRRIGALALQEGARTIRKAGYRLRPLPGVPFAALALMIAAPLPLAAGLLDLSMRNLDTLSSTLQSLRRGRPTEIDYLNGEIVRLGGELGLATPYNARIVELVKQNERSGRFPAVEALVREFGV